ncbi:alpha/beta hydrolase [Thalassotalea piscium]
MRIIASILLLFCLIDTGSAFAQNKTKKISKSHFSIGETLEFNSVTLNEKRVINIYLPSSYKANKTQNYPVIYLLDGSSDEDFIHISGLVQFNAFPWINNIPETIVVGISNVDRKRDFTFPTDNTLDFKEFPTSGHSAKFIHFIANELQPLVEENYRTNKTKTIIGQSLGGLLATEVLLKSPELFDHYIIISPSLWWDDGSLLTVLPQMPNSPKSIYIGVGKEGEIMERDAKKLYTKLKNTLVKNTQINFQFFDKLDHGDTLHLAVYDAFGKIFKH